MADNSNPGHYKTGGVECIDALRDIMTFDEFAGFLRGNVMKYMWRYTEKNGLEDLKKAQVYLKWLINHEEGLTEDDIPESDTIQMSYEDFKELAWYK